VQTFSTTRSRHFFSFLRS
jgi:hypothetical protein